MQGLHVRRPFRATCLSILALAFLISIQVVGEEVEDPVILVFFEEGCPSCQTVEELIAELALDLPSTAMRRYEISDPDSFDLLAALGKAYEIEVGTVPTVFVGDEVIVGAGQAAEFALRAAIGGCSTRGCPSPLDRVRPTSFPWADLFRVSGYAALLLLLLFLQPL